MDALLTSTATLLMPTAAAYSRPSVDRAIVERKYVIPVTRALEKISSIFTNDNKYA